MRGLALFLGIALATPGLASAQLRTVEHAWAADGLREVELDVSVGEVTVRGTTGDRVEIRVGVGCDEDGWGSSSCPERAGDVDVTDRRGDGRLSLEVDGPGIWGSRGLHLDVELLIPSRLALRLDMGVGELEIVDLEGDVAVDMGIGEVSLRMPEAALESLSLDTGIGESSLRAPSRNEESAGLFTRTIDWRVRRGHARVRIELHIGEIDVRLS